MNNEQGSMIHKRLTMNLE